MRSKISIRLLAGLMTCNAPEPEIEVTHPEYVIPQGIIELDSDFAKKIGFISKRFISCSHLWGEGNRVIVQTIECTDRRRGYLRELFRAIWEMGGEIAVRTPLSTMEQILLHYGFRKTFVPDPKYGRSELWVK